MSYDIDIMQEVLEEILDEIDPDLFKGLNGGVILKEEIKYHKESINNDLVVLGEYTRFGVLKQIFLAVQTMILIQVLMRNFLVIKNILMLNGKK